MDYKTVIEETEKYYLPVFGRYPLVIDHGVQQMLNVSSSRAMKTRTKYTLRSKE